MCTSEDTSYAYIRLFQSACPIAACRRNFFTLGVRCSIIITHMHSLAAVTLLTASRVGTKAWVRTSRDSVLSGNKWAENTCNFLAGGPTTRIMQQRCAQLYVHTTHVHGPLLDHHEFHDTRLNIRACPTRRVWRVKDATTWLFFNFASQLAEAMAGVSVHLELAGNHGNSRLRQHYLFKVI